MRNLRAQGIFRGATAARTRGVGAWPALVACGLVGMGALVGCVSGSDVTDEELNAVRQATGGGAGGSGTAGTAGNNGGGTAGTGTAGTNGGGTAGTGTAGTAGNNGGGTAGSGNAGTAGTNGGGTGGSGNQPVAVGDCADEGPVNDIELSVLYTERAQDNQISMVLGVENVGNGFPLSQLVLRYWFDDDGVEVTVADIDYTDAPGGVSVSFGEALGSNYADVNFNDSGDIGQGVSQIQIRLHTSNYANLDHTNDFSYSAGADAVINRNISAYVDGTKVFGCEPGAE